MSTTNEIIEALTAFVTKIDETILHGKREGVLRSTEEVYTRYPIDEKSIEQTDYGVKRRNYATEEFVKDSWFHATRAVVWRLQESREYAKCWKGYQLNPKGQLDYSTRFCIGSHTSFWGQPRKRHALGSWQSNWKQ